MTLYHTQILPPPYELTNSVECIRLFEFSGEKEFSIKTSPIAVPGLVFQNRGGDSAIKSLVYKNKTTTMFPHVFIYGPGTKPSVMNYYSGPWNTVQVIFKPHALRTLLALDATKLTDNLLDWQEFSEKDLTSRLIQERCTKKQVAIINSALTTYANQTKTVDSLVESSLEYIHKNIQSVSKQELLEKYIISERQFEKRFKKTVGITPHAYIRVVRFNQALQLMKSKKFERLVDVVATLTYYDQAHFIRDLKEFTGITPKSILERVDNFHKQSGFYYTQD